MSAVSIADPPPQPGPVDGPDVAGPSSIDSDLVAGGGDILVVDDSPANLLAVEAALGDFGGRVVRAQSGIEALGKLLTQDFALILLDVKMPSMDGLETARMIRSRKRSAHTPIIFLTAHSRDDREVHAAYALGAVDFLFKPLVQEVLQAKVAVFVELQRRTAKVAHQAELLRAHERREHERVLESERRRWEAELMHRQMEELRDADKRKDAFLALLGHELRNPLMPIITGLELLKRKVLDGPNVDPGNLRVWRTIERQTKHLTRLVDDLLDVSRINSGKVELRASSVSVQEVIEQALATSQPWLDERGHTLTLDVPSTPIVLRCDTVRLVQALANLLNNAARYTEPNGRIRVSCKQTGGWIEIAVADTGRGITPELLPHIFDMFVQERHAAEGGLGLGLALASQLVKLHGGTLTAHSDGPGKGSQFIVRLPLLGEVTAGPPVFGSSASTRPAAEGPDSVPLVIVVVDDQRDIRDLMQELLSTWGHRVEIAADGQTAVQLIVDLRPDIAFVDIGLPDMKGHEVASRVREALGQDRPRLIAMTGFGRAADRSASLEAGFDQHFVKPVDAESLRKALFTEEI